MEGVEFVELTEEDAPAVGDILIKIVCQKWEDYGVKQLKKK